MSDTLQILIQRGAQRFGPLPPVEVLNHHRDRRLLATDLAWHPGMAEWEPLGSLMARLGSPLPPQTEEITSWMIPVGRSGWAIAAGYLGLFSILMIPAPIAIFCGIMALRSLKRNPHLGGKGRAWFGLVMGVIFSIPFGLTLLAPLFNSAR